MIVWQEQLPETATKIEITAFGDDQSHTSRFRDALFDVWSSIPATDRTNIATYWTRDDSQSIPQIVLDDPWHGNKASYGCVEASGFCVKFDWPLLQLYPTDKMRFILAHELAHVYQWAIGKHREALTDADLSESIRGVVHQMVGVKGRVELHADEVMLRWGFQPLGGITWLHQHFSFKKDGAAIKREPPIQHGSARSKAKRIRLLAYHSKLWES